MTEIDLAAAARRSEGLILEFGVGSGSTTRNLAHSGKVVYGFDWFGGLPHEWCEGHPRGKFRCGIPVLPENVRIYRGLFSDTLEPFLLAQPGPVGLVHIDCDLYAPTYYVLRMLKDRFVAGSMIAFDEITEPVGERQAWERYLREVRQNWELEGKQHIQGEIWICRP